MLPEFHFHSYFFIKWITFPKPRGAGASVIILHFGRLFCLLGVWHLCKEVQWEKLLTGECKIKQTAQPDWMKASSSWGWSPAMVWADAAAPIAVSGGTDLLGTGERFYSGWADVLLKWCKQQGAVLGLCISFVLGSQWVHWCCLATASFVGMIKAKFCVSPPCLRPPEGPYWCHSSPGWDLWGYLRNSFPEHLFGHSEQLTTSERLGWASWPWFPSTGSLCPSLEVGWGSPAALHLQTRAEPQGTLVLFVHPFPELLLCCKGFTSHV